MNVFNHSSGSDTVRNDYYQSTRIVKYLSADIEARRQHQILTTVVKYSRHIYMACFWHIHEFTIYGAESILAHDYAIVLFKARTNNTETQFTVSPLETAIAGNIVRAALTRMVQLWVDGSDRSAVCRTNCPCALATRRRMHVATQIDRQCTRRHNQYHKNCRRKNGGANALPTHTQCGAVVIYSIRSIISTRPSGTGSTCFAREPRPQVNRKNGVRLESTKFAI